MVSFWTHEKPASVFYVFVIRLEISCDSNKIIFFFKIFEFLSVQHPSRGMDASAGNDTPVHASALQHSCPLSHDLYLDIRFKALDQ